MDKSRDDVLPCAALPVDQDRDIGGCDLRQLGPNRLHGLGVAEDDVLRGNFA